MWGLVVEALEWVLPFPLQVQAFCILPLRFCQIMALYGTIQSVHLRSSCRLALPPNVYRHPLSSRVVIPYFLRLRAKNLSLFLGVERIVTPLEVLRIQFLSHFVKVGPVELDSLECLHQRKIFGPYQLQGQS